MRCGASTTTDDSIENKLWNSFRVSLHFLRSQLSAELNPGHDLRPHLYRLPAPRTKRPRARPSIPVEPPRGPTAIDTVSARHKVTYTADAKSQQSTVIKLIIPRARTSFCFVTFAIITCVKICFTYKMIIQDVMYHFIFPEYRVWIFPCWLVDRQTSSHSSHAEKVLIECSSIDPGVLTVVSIEYWSRHWLLVSN